MGKTSLVIMAAGIGSRYGAGIKQLAPVGEHGEIIMDYSIHDAMQAGFDDVIFIIRKDIEEEFREVIGRRIEKSVDVSYAFQEVDDLPDGFVCPPERKKPWGTGHAILAARELIKNPFCVINADDYYGQTAYRLMHTTLADGMTPDQAYMAGFILGNTLSPNGTVTRGLCETDAAGKLISIAETKNLVPTEEAPYAAIRDGETLVPVDAKGLVSMNFWGFHERFVETLAEGFTSFLKAEGNEAGAEYLLPTIVDSAMKEDGLSVGVLPTEDRWLGITYHVDLPEVQAAFADMIKAGVYPSPLS